MMINNEKFIKNLILPFFVFIIFIGNTCFCGSRLLRVYHSSVADIPLYKYSVAVVGNSHATTFSQYNKIDNDFNAPWVGNHSVAGDEFDSDGGASERSDVYGKSISGPYELKGIISSFIDDSIFYKTAILFFGGNLLPIAPEDFYKQYKLFVDKVLEKNPKIKLILMSLPYATDSFIDIHKTDKPWYNHENVDNFNKQIEKLVSEYPDNLCYEFLEGYENSYSDTLHLTPEYHRNLWKKLKEKYNLEDVIKVSEVDKITDVEASWIGLVSDFSKNTEAFYNKINGAPNLTKFKANGFIVYKNETDLFQDIRGLYSAEDKYAVAVNRLRGELTVYRFNPDDNKYNIPVVCFACSPNKERTPLGLYHTMEKYRWHKMFGNVYCQYCIRFYEHFLLHSVVYKQDGNPNSLVAHTYNGLLSGEQSGGCVRLRVCDIKWLYENLKDNTPVYIYESEVEGPLPKLVFSLIPNEQTYDPTDAEATK